MKDRRRLRYRCEPGGSASLMGLGGSDPFEELQLGRRDVLKVPLGEVERSREVGRSSPPRPNAANMACTDSLLHNVAPIPVPSVFVMISVMPESRVGRNACNTSIVRLVTAAQNDSGKYCPVQAAHRHKICTEKEPKGNESGNVDQDILPIAPAGLELIPRRFEERRMQNKKMFWNAKISF